MDLSPLQPCKRVRVFSSSSYRSLFFKKIWLLFHIVGAIHNLEGNFCEHNLTVFNVFWMKAAAYSLTFASRALLNKCERGLVLCECGELKGSRSRFWPDRFDLINVRNQFSFSSPVTLIRLKFRRRRRKEKVSVCLISPSLFLWS